MEEAEEPSAEKKEKESEIAVAYVASAAGAIISEDCHLPQKMIASAAGPIISENCIRRWSHYFRGLPPAAEGDEEEEAEDPLHHGLPPAAEPLFQKRRCHLPLEPLF